MRPRTLFWKLFLGNALVLGVVVFVSSVVVFGAFNRFTVPESGTRHMVWATLMTAVLTSLVAAMVLARFWSARIRRITAAARRLSRGDLSAKAEVFGSDETAILARSLNQMRDHLVRHLGTIDRQRRTLSSLLAQLREGVVVTGPDERIVLVNPEAQRLLRLTSPKPDGTFEGLTVERCIPQHDLQLLLRPAAQFGADQSENTHVDPSIVPPAEAEGHFQEIRIQVGGPDGPVSLLARACDMLLPATDGEAESSSGPSRPGRLLVLTDITELARAIQVKADFASNASHELRTPLSAIVAAVETIRSLDPQEYRKDADHFLDVIERHSRRMQAMVVDLLDLARLESPLVSFDSVRLPTRDVITEMHDAFADTLVDKELQWQVTIAPDCRELVAQPDLIRIALRNLIENAIRFTPAGGRVELVAQRVNGSVQLEVVDTGCGIPPAEQPRVFERFYQVGRARSGPDRGTGLGLSIVRHAVAAMNGTVELQSAVGKGTRVTIVLPQSG